MNSTPASQQAPKMSPEDEKVLADLCSTYSRLLGKGGALNIGLLVAAAGLIQRQACELDDRARELEARAAEIERLRGLYEAAETQRKEAEDDWSSIDGFLNRIDAQIIESLTRCGAPPDEYGGMPDRVDAACGLMERQTRELMERDAKIERLKGLLEAYRGGARPCTSYW